MASTRRTLSEIRESLGKFIDAGLEPPADHPDMLYLTQTPYRRSRVHEERDGLLLISDGKF